MRKAIAAAALLVSTACGGSGSPTTASTPTTEAVVHVLGVEITPSSDDTATMAFVAHNAGSTTDVLVSVTCTCARAAEIVGEIAIEPQRTGSFGADGPHVTLRRFDASVAAGSFVDVVLTFEHAGPSSFTAEVMRG